MLANAPFSKYSCYFRCINESFTTCLLNSFPVSSMPQNMVAIYRISTKFSETFRYDSAHLRKVDFDTANVQLVVSGRNRVTLQSQTVACLTVPLASCGKMTTPQWLPLVYRILLPSGQYVEEQQPLQQSKSWEDRRMYKLFAI